jgi:hypothetical protein
MLTKMTLPNGKVVFPGSSIPPSRIVTKEFQHTEEFRMEVATRIEGLLPMMFTTSEEPDIPTVSNEGAEPTVKINQGTYRVTALVSMDWRNNVMTQPLNDQTKGSLPRKEVLDELNKLGVKVKTTSNSIKKAAQSSKREPLVGTEDIKRKLANSTDCGASAIYDRCTREPDIGSLMHSVGLFKFCVFRSPVLAGLMIEILKNIREGKRSLVYTDTPWATS